MFLIYINDLPDILKHSNPLLFADDTKIYAIVCSVDDCQLIQDDLDALCHWCKIWKLDLNIAKCKVLSVTKSHNPIVFRYHINGKPLERVQELNDLGVLIQNNLSWNNHVDITVEKAYRMMGLIKRTVGYHAPQNVKQQLYTTLVRSNLEYCTQAWNGLTARNRVKLERVQRAATRYILNFPNISYTDRLSLLNLLPLSFRRDMLDLKFYYKSVNRLNELELYDFVNFSRDSIVNTRSSSDPNLIKIPFCKTTTFRNTFVNRIPYS
jgi:hypothetical protein